jgi:3-hydroxypropanoate dehydrogenase
MKPDSLNKNNGVKMTQLNTEGLKLLFTEARTHNGWKNQKVEAFLLEEIYNLAKMAPTSANCSPMRLVFVKTKEGKEKLKSCLMEGNIEKTMTAPVTVIIGYDLKFYEELPKLFPHMECKSWFEGNENFSLETAFRNSSLQGAYFMLAARAMGLDCGAMSGFDAQKVDELFFKGTKVKSNFLCNLGYGDASKLYPRSPRLSFDECCKIA